jgi:hypothetical protein
MRSAGSGVGPWRAVSVDAAATAEGAASVGPATAEAQKAAGPGPSRPKHIGGASDAFRPGGASDVYRR